jgi:hypothetical protein
VSASVTRSRKKRWLPIKATNHNTAAAIRKNGSLIVNRKSRIISALITSEPIWDCYLGGAVATFPNDLMPTADLSVGRQSVREISFRRSVVVKGWGDIPVPTRLFARTTCSKPA